MIKNKTPSSVIAAVLMVLLLVNVANAHVFDMSNDEELSNCMTLLVLAKNAAIEANKAGPASNVFLTPTYRKLGTKLFDPEFSFVERIRPMMTPELISAFGIFSICKGVPFQTSLNIAPLFKYACDKPQETDKMACVHRLMGAVPTP